jgi:diguanylate cyclase (GGDEF)-like protein/PAS domain S-box-containing protein
MSGSAPDAERKQLEETLRDSEADLARAQAIAHVGSWRLDIAQDVLNWSAEAYRIFGIAPGTPLNLARFLACVHPDDRGRLLDAWNAAVAGAPYDIEHRIVVDGAVRWVRERAEVRLDAAGRPAVGFGAVQDITELKQVEQELRIAAVAFEARDGMIVTDAAGTILRVNRAFTDITGYRAEEAIGRTPALLRSGRQNDAFYRTLWEAIRREGRWQGEIWNRRKDGSVFPEWLSISAIRDGGGNITHFLGEFSELSEPREAQRKLMELAFYDSLTGLPNRRLLLDRLNQALAGSARGGEFGALLLLDLDQFKTLNDTRGHDVGDQLLVEVACRLRGALREVDTAARLGGDEFVVLLEDLGGEEMAAAASAEMAAEKIRAAIARPYALKGVDCHITTSIGITLFRNHDDQVDTLLKQADLALYQSKDAGRDTNRFYNPAMQSAMEVRAALEAGLRRALVEDELLLHYQPQVDENGTLVGVEALLRWQPRGAPMVSPTAFIPVAETSGLILPIGRWVLESACAQLADWAHRPALRDVQLAVNISARQFRQPDFVAEVREMIERRGVDPARLKLELTESLVVEDVEQVIRTMTALKELGVAFSLDDFGTGYSSLTYLKRLPLDQIKIDQSFVLGLPTDPDDCAITRAIIALGQSLRLQVIAEGVETESQRAFLAAHGCLAYQGYLFGRPGPVEAIEHMAVPA